ncbi:nuclear transport factor 2 family protein [Microbulbifer sp. THAF38]|uniref:nuclear transport factor 2 family protein n=1 Tax=Microbulbifer sp. THAF38 TaxID=2587856 RepID=UPI00126902F3|nr:nuclear transport factor 2 family protein [Microbulbifer sp. THAF38]
MKSKIANKKGEFIVRNYLMALGFTAISIFLPTAIAEQHHVVAGPQATVELEKEITIMDSQLFDAVFNSCDINKLSQLVTDDFEMYHDKWGKTASSAREFLDDISKLCERQKSGSDIKARRELISDSVKIFPMNNYGAIQSGTHKFYGINADNSEVLRESGQFTHLWKKVDGQWKLARVLSFDHQPASSGH